MFSWSQLLTGYWHANKYKNLWKTIQRFLNHWLPTYFIVVTPRSRFDDLPDEILLIICRYLSPADVLKAFHDYNTRLWSCISEYRQSICLDKTSYADMHYFLPLLANGQYRPTTLTIGNERMPTQIHAVNKALKVDSLFQWNAIVDLALLHCTTGDLYMVRSFVKRFEGLESLRIVQPMSNPGKHQFNCFTISELRELLSSKLIKLELTIIGGLVLDKQLHPNSYLQELTISLPTIADLLILIDGLVPNLRRLDVLICQASSNRLSSVPHEWPRRPMAHLIDLRLTTIEEVTMGMEHLRTIVMPLTSLETLSIDVRQWTDDEHSFIRGDALESLFKQYLPQLRQFYCSVHTNQPIDMQTFTSLNKRWPMAYCSTSLNLYTVSWPFEHLKLSLLAENDTASICPRVQDLTVDTPTINLPQRFPNVRSLTIQSQSDLPVDQFRHLQHLIVVNIERIPSSLPRRIRKLTLVEPFRVLTEPRRYPHVEHLVVRNNSTYSLETIIALVRCFPNLRSIDIPMTENNEFDDCLDVLLDGEHLSSLVSFKTVWTGRYAYHSNIHIWLMAHTPLKWKSTPFYAHSDHSSLFTAW